MTSQQARHWDDEARDSLVGLDDTMIDYLATEYFTGGFRGVLSFEHFARTAIQIRREWDGTAEEIRRN